MNNLNQLDVIKKFEEFVMMFEEKLYIPTGGGSNGKSLTFEIVNNALGEYYISCPVTIMTRKRGSSAQASPELARIKG